MIWFWTEREREREWSEKNEDDEGREGDEPYGRLPEGAPQEGIETGTHSLS